MVSFVDLKGNPTGPSLSFNLQAGQSTFLDYPGTSLPAGQRMQILPVLTQTALNPDAVGCEASAEVFAASTGDTIMEGCSFIPAALFAPVGLSSSQTLRLNFAAPPDVPCTFSVSFTYFDPTS